MAIKVTVRQKAITKGRMSLYLDFYPEIIDPQTGVKTRREFLKRYIIEKPKNTLEREQNKESLSFAEQIRASRENYFNKPEIYSEQEKEILKYKEIGERNFVEYFKSLVAKRKGSNYENWLSAYKHLRDFTGGILTFSNLNESFCDSFREYLLSAKRRGNSKLLLSQNSALSYYTKFRTALNQAFRDRFLKEDISKRLRPIKEKEAQRQFLELEELQLLLNTPCESEVIKRASLFSALTGLRYSDVEKLTWSNIHQSERGYSIEYVQKKTNDKEYLPISPSAYSFLGVPKQDNSKIFEGLKYSVTMNKIIRKWVNEANITKHITFHCFRHTFATIQISEGTELYTVSKLLGHKSLRNTQIYAKVVDEKKREATNKIKLDL
ncbi:site-specific integrase [Flectobacillus longus]|uniref:site-specific integrase n=1 Tax=Flectobacillus longus TaxID=2984207 RepID=UPI0024B69961|nr:site-specific integrase [Flectobacillus longus]MDI9878064.1 site-specific integrase [Flectobacillus longus]